MSYCLVLVKVMYFKSYFPNRLLLCSGFVLNIPPVKSFVYYVVSFGGSECVVYCCCEMTAWVFLHAVGQTVDSVFYHLFPSLNDYYQQLPVLLTTIFHGGRKDYFKSALFSYTTNTQGLITVWKA